MVPTPRMRLRNPCVTCTARMCLSETEVRSLLKMIIEAEKPQKSTDSKRVYDLADNTAANKNLIG
jgi:hypothetical protein